MRLQTILNCVERNKSFVYGAARLEGSGPDLRLMVPIRPRKDCRPECSGCGRKGSTYDRQKEPPLFEFVPLWGIAVFFVYRMRRVKCGVRVERVAWCDGKSPQTTSYRWYLATWAKRSSWSEVATILHTSWNSVCRAVQRGCRIGICAE